MWETSQLVVVEREGSKTGFLCSLRFLGYIQLGTVRVFESTLPGPLLSQMRLLIQSSNYVSLFGGSESGYPPLSG